MMSVKILEQKKNPLLKREEVRAIFEHTGKPTPPREKIFPFLEKALRAKKDLILIDKIFSIKGKGESKLKVFVYSKKDDIPKEKLELIKKRAEKNKIKKEKPEEKPAEGAKEEEVRPEEKEEAKPEEKPAEKEGEEKPAEEKKEEVKEEEKPKEEPKKEGEKEGKD